jgi:hypothetical protein
MERGDKTSMKFSYYDLKQRSRGDVVKVTLSGNAANVFLVDTTNFLAYKAGKKYRYTGGHATKSPVRLVVPRAGHWYLVIDFGGYRGHVKHSIEILPGPKPALQEAPLSTVPSLVHAPPLATGENDPAQTNRTFDVFISHASEDKDQVARPLADALQDGGLDVWYDEITLRIGDSLRRKIDEGVARSKFSVVVLSKAYLSKGWTQYELDGLVGRSVGGEQVILPIWHGLTKQEVIEFSPSLADKLARSTATHTVEEIASEIIERIQAG